MDQGNLLILSRLFKIVLFFIILFSLIFWVTWQNVQMYILQRKTEELARERSALQKSLYLKNMELAELQSRERIKRIAVQEFSMVPVSYRDIRLIVY